MSAPGTTPRRRSPKGVTLLAVILLGSAALLCWTMTWFTVRLSGTDAAHTLEATGESASPALAALGLACLALAAALAIAGPIFRVILGVFQAGIGAAIAWSAATTLADPVGSVTAVVTQATGIAGADSVRDAVASAGPTMWPVVALIVGILMVVMGAAIIIFGRRWPATSRKYQPAAAATDPDAAVEPGPIGDWDSLSDGSDPTSR